MGTNDADPANPQDQHNDSSIRAVEALIRLLELGDEERAELTTEQVEFLRERTGLDFVDRLLQGDL